MATDYDAIRRSDMDDTDGDTVQELRASHATARSGSIDADEDALVDSPELAGPDLTEVLEGELTMRVVPRQHNEFVCTSCFLVQHRNRLVYRRNGRAVCRDCA